MLSDRIRSRLAQLNREPLPAAVPARQPFPIPVAQQVKLPAIRQPQGKCGREIETPYGKHWLVERPLHAWWDQSQHAVSRWRKSQSQHVTTAPRHPDWLHFAQRFPNQCVFLDLETCGFAGAMIFLVGVIHEAEGELVLAQLLARNYAEEPAMLFTLWRLMRSRGTLLTFNGKCFDWPMVNDRSVLHRLDAASQTRTADQHIDLLHHARRRYRRELPNCRLQTLEWYLCGRRRVGDIAGGDIPDAYHHYVRTGDKTEMKSILHHNALDLITLLQLSLRLSFA